MPQSELIPHLVMQLWKTTHSQIFHFDLPPRSSQDPLQSLSHAAVPATLLSFLLTVVVMSLHTLIIGINVMSFYFFNQFFPRVERLCRSGSRAGHLLIGRLVVQSPSAQSACQITRSWSLMRPSECECWIEWVNVVVCSAI